MISRASAKALHTADTSTPTAPPKKPVRPTRCPHSYRSRACVIQARPPICITALEHGQDDPARINRRIGLREDFSAPAQAQSSPLPERACNRFDAQRKIAERKFGRTSSRSRKRST